MNNDMDINDSSEMMRGKTFAKEMNNANKKKSVKKSKNVKRIPRKTMSVVEKDLKTEYQKYLNVINRRKVCKKKTFRQFVDDKIGKKHRRKSKKAKVASEEPVAVAAEEMPSPSVEPAAEVPASVEETPSPSVEPAAEVPASVEETPSSPVEPMSSAVEPTQVEESTSAVKPMGDASSEEVKEPSTEEKPKGIFDTITSALSPTEEKKKGGKKKSGRKNGKGLSRSKRSCMW